MSIVLSALGWVVAVMLFAGALFWGKPYYQASGYETGRAMATQNNRDAVDAVVKHRVIEGQDYVVLGRFISATAEEIKIETINPYLLNPLSKERRVQTIRIDAQTVLEKRSPLSEAELFAVLEDARNRGLDTQQTIQHKQEVLTLDMLQPGDEIRVYPAIAQEAVEDTFYAKQVLFVVSAQQSLLPAN